MKATVVLVFIAAASAVYFGAGTAKHGVQVLKHRSAAIEAAAQ